MWAKIGIHKASEDQYSCYYDETLEHGGFSYRTLATVTVDELSNIDVLILAGYGKLEGESYKAVSEWVDRGGALVCSGSSWGFNDELGLLHAGHHASNAYLTPVSSDRLWPEQTHRIRFFGGELYRPGKCGVIATSGDGWVGIGRMVRGRGLTIFVGPHVGQTMALMQMGRSVETDGIGPDDDSAILDDGFLRSEDGTALSFENDRLTLKNDPNPYFAFPYADSLKDAFLRAVMNAADHTGKNALVLWQWPNMAPAAMMLTLDCEDLMPEHVYPMYQLLSMHGCPAAWIVPSPGYPLDVYRMISRWEHEFGTLFTIDNTGGWAEHHLRLQQTALSRAASVQSLVTTRPVNGLWKGWDAFYDMCEVSGARVSISKGGRQAGTAGFLFGTCHPFFSRRKDGLQRLVMEIPYQVYMPGATVSDAACDAIFAQTLAQGGCLHFVATPESITNSAISNSIRRLIINGRSSRVAFMQPEQMWKFEKTRRSIRKAMNANSEEGQLVLIPESAIEGLTVMISGPPVNVEMKGRMAQVTQVQKYGTTFTTFQSNIEQKHQLEVRLKVLQPAKVA